MPCTLFIAEGMKGSFYLVPPAPPLSESSSTHGKWWMSQGRGIAEIGEKQQVLQAGHVLMSRLCPEQGVEPVATVATDCPLPP